jgi:hypothetical protein
MSTKIHTEFDPETNARLNDLYAAWDCADRRAAQYDHGDTAVLYFENGEPRTMSAQPLVDEAEALWRQYDVALKDAKTHCQPHQITAGVYDTTIKFNTTENAQIFATEVNGKLDGRSVHTQASLVDINRAIARIGFFDSEIMGRSSYPVNREALTRLSSLGRGVQHSHWSAKR